MICGFNGMKYQKKKSAGLKINQTETEPGGIRAGGIMRQITVKYDGECKRCGADLETGTQAMYEKSMGCFCVGCEPTEVEEIREFRLAKAEKRAARYEGWAEKRERRANAALNSHPEIRHDWAFITQPGRIPFRDRMNKADEKAFESLKVADNMRYKAKSLRCVRVAGDAERKREAYREKIDTLISKGSMVHDACFGKGEVVGVYKKSYRIKFSSGYTFARDKSFVCPLNMSK